MTEPTIIRWKGTAIGLYFMNAGDKIDMHQHAWDHTICLLIGAGEFEIVGRGVTTMELCRNYILPANIDHEIRATAGGTIMIGATDDRKNLTEPSPPIHGGITLHDGAVIPHDEIT